jgi:hypothetical protein
MNINNKNAKLFNELMGKVPLDILYREVFGMTQEEADAAKAKIYQEHIRHNSQVEAIYTAKARNEARKECGFRERPGEEVKPMETSTLFSLMTGGNQQQEPEPEEEEL